MTESKQYLIFSDMDGTLLDHYNYSFEPVKPMLAALDKLAIPVIPVSSKTKAELLYLRGQFNNTSAFIIENGAAIYLPKQHFTQQPEGTTEDGEFWVKGFVEPRLTWQKLIESLSEEFGHSFKTFEQIGIEGIIDATQLDYESAVRASQRHFGEPVAWYGTEHKKGLFIDALTQAGAHVLQGGRFMHVSGQCDKGKALLWFAQHYAQLMNVEIETIAAGDSQNDVAMLEVANHALVIRSPVHEPPILSRSDNVIISKATGPNGWAEGMAEIIPSTLNFLKTQ